MLSLCMPGLPVLVTYQLPWTLLSHAVQGSPDAGLYCTIFGYAEILPFIVIGYVRYKQSIHSSNFKSLVAKF
jgi:hypothetical protein